MSSIFLLQASFSSAHALSHIASIYKLDTISEAEQFLDDKTLVIIDLDHTLFEADQTYGHANWFYDQISFGRENGYNAQDIISKMYPHWLVSQKTTSVKPVEPQVVNIINDLHRRNIPVIGGTSRQPIISESTIKQVNSLNIKFSNFTLNKLQKDEFPSKTEVKDGIIFCSDYNNKGAVLKAYLEGNLNDINKVVFIDDGFNNVSSVVSYFRSLPVEVVGLHYPLVESAKISNWDALLGQKVFYEAYLENNDKLQPAFIEKRAQVHQQKGLLEKHDALAGPYEFEMLGRHYVGLPGVFSPIIFSGDAYLQSQIPLHRNITFLEIGPATGYFATHVALKGAKKVVALDINEISVKNTKQNAKLHNVEHLVEARVSDIFSALKQNETFDAIFWDIPQSHTDKKELSDLEKSVFDPNHQLLQKFLSQAARHLNTNGKVYLVYSKTHGNESFLRACAEIYHWNMVELANLGEDGDFLASLYELIPNKVS